MMTVVIVLLVLILLFVSTPEKDKEKLRGILSVIFLVGGAIYLVGPFVLAITAVGAEHAWPVAKLVGEWVLGLSVVCYIVGIIFSALFLTYYCPTCKAEVNKARRKSGSSENDAYCGKCSSKLACVHVWDRQRGLSIGWTRWLICIFLATCGVTFIGAKLDAPQTFRDVTVVVLLLVIGAITVTVVVKYCVSFARGLSVGLGQKE